MKTRLIIALFLSVLYFQTGCNKEDSDPWTYCDDCTIDSWVGEYVGEGEYFNFKSEAFVTDIPTTLNIENTSDNILKISVVGKDYYSGSFTKIKDDNSNGIEVAGSTQSLSLTLSHKSDAFKLSGSVKKYRYIPDINLNDSLVMEYTLAFEVFRDL